MGELLCNMIKKDRLHLLKDMKYFDFYVVSPQFRNLGELRESLYSNVGWLFCTPAPPKFTKKLAVDSFFNFGS